MTTRQSSAVTDRDAEAPHGSLFGLTISALGVVLGSIGTSPLYALDQIFSPAVTRTPDHIIGGLSLVVWTVTLIVSVKFALLVLRAQNDGEGGVFALYGLVHDQKIRGARMLLWSLMLGAGLLLGDGIISPAISVLSAVEGLKLAAPELDAAIVPIAVVLLTGIFAIQYKGTAGIGRLFGPVMLVWFVALAVFGAKGIADHPGILAALDPRYGLRFLAETGTWPTLMVLGSLMLVVTGGEALYADVGHFGAGPIRLGWFGVVYPALVLNYLGQGAYLLGGGQVAGDKLFFSLVPASLLTAMILLATLATTIAAQGLISGVFSLTLQAIRLGLFPRLEIRHTHQAHAGQIYVPFINWFLLAGCIALVVGFGSSSALAAAYGLAVAGVMLITSVAMASVARRHWRWGRLPTLIVWGGFSLVNGAFVVATSLKFHEGGYVPVLVGVAAFVVMATWRWGRKATYASYSAKSSLTMAEIVERHRQSPHFIERNALVMAAKPLRRMTDRVPALIQMLWERAGVLPRNLIIVEVTHKKVPYLKGDRYLVTPFLREGTGGSIIGVELSFGFMEEPNVERLLEDLARHHAIDLPTDPRRWIVHVAHENLLPSRRMSMWRRIRFGLFVILRNISRPSWQYYGLGDEVQLSAEIIPVRVK